MTDFLEKLGSWVASTREARGLSQQNLAEQLGTDQPTVSRIENGQRGLLLEEFLRIVEALGVPDAEMHGVLRRLKEAAAGQGSIWNRHISS